jgi:ABC-type transport system substrate-binding protein
MHLNVNKQFKDNRLVRAMNMAFDRRQIIQSLHQGLGQVSGAVPWLQEGFAMKTEDLIKLPGYRVDRAAEIKDARDLWNAGGGPALGDVDIKVEASWSALFPDTSQLITKMFNDALGVSQIKSTKCTYNDDIIPNLLKGEYPNWMAWTNAVTSPDPRVETYSNWYSKGSANYSHVNDPALDKLLADAIATADLTKARDLSLQAQKIILDNGLYGWCILYNYISRGARWNFAHTPLKTEAGAGKPGSGYWNTANQAKSIKESWFDPKDPSYADAVKNRTLG